MCGIAGSYGPADIRRMTATLTHRGPDDEGFFADGPVQFGARRLAIIDLTTGHQPLSTTDGSHWITYNGELFNYLEIRVELEGLGFQFKTTSDTEVVVTAYKAWGARSLDRFVGMFAFAIWDGREIFIARDRLGEKPLFYWTQGDRFLFASEIKALLVEVTPEVAIDDRFPVLETVLEPDTLFRGIRALEPGCHLIFDGRTATVRRYWSIPEGPIDGRSASDLTEELRFLLADAVRLRLRSDVPIGLFLSGGLDSSLLAAMARPAKTFTCHLPYGPAYDELNYARLMAEAIGSEMHTVTVTPEDFRRDFPKVIWHLEQPIATTSSIAEFALARLARQHVKVAIGGQGADEAFGGYVRYALLAEEERMGASPLFRDYHPLARLLWGPQVFGPPADRYFQLIQRGVGSEAPLEEARRIFSRPGSLVDRMGAVDFRMTFPSLITMNDRAAAAFGVENRTPLLDHRLIEFAFKLRPELKLNAGQTKVILRQASRGLVPDAIIDRPEKKGLGVPVGRWFQNELKDWAAELTRSLEQRGIMLNAAQDRGEFDRTLFTRVSLELWFRTFIDNRGAGPVA
jgi:asparagine synthase (glutamine-hydrolysing)